MKEDDEMVKEERVWNYKSDGEEGESTNGGMKNEFGSKRQGERNMERGETRL